MKWSFCDLKLFSSLIATSKAHTPLGGFCDAAMRGQRNARSIFSFFLRTVPAESVVSFSFKWHQIISGILIAEHREWDALPVMTNVAAELRSHGDRAGERGMDELLRLPVA